MAAAGERYQGWHRSALAVGGLISFTRSVLDLISGRKGHQLAEAARDGNLSEVEQFLNRGANPNVATLVAYGPKDREISGGTPLMAAASNGHVEIVRALLRRGARVNDTDIRGWTALVCAAENGHATICKLLLDAHADPNIRTRQSGTVLMVAALKGHLEIVRLLLEKGADSSARDATGQSALDLARKYLRSDVVEILKREP